MNKLIAPAALIACFATGCTVVNTASVPADRSGREIFVTAGDIPEPYTTLGAIQATRSGPILLGFIDVAGTDLEAGFHRVLIPEIKRLGGDGAINVRFSQNQYLPVTRALFAFPLFFIPLPGSVTISGEVVKLQRPQ